MKKLIISAKTTEKRVAIFENDKLVELITDTPMQVEVGNIYLGRVEKVIQGMQAAFINIGLDKNGFLQREQMILTDEQKETHYSISSLLHEGEKKLVQIVKEPFGTKGPRLTDNIELTGKYIVYLPKGKYIAVSRKIKDEREREVWRELGKSLTKNEEGLIFRTTCSDQNSVLIEEELHYLRSKWDKLATQAMQAKPPALLYENTDVYDRLTRDFIFTEKDEIIIDDLMAFKQIETRLQHYSTPPKNLVLYRGKENVFSHYLVNHEIEKALKPHIWLKNGASILFEQTEALTVVDVNTTKFTGESSKEETIVKVNDQAAAEIARQLRLRNVGGIILIDFINMKSEAAKQRVLDTLRKELSKDKLLTRVLGFTQLGLVEMTRKKERASLYDVLLKPCSTCSGTGMVNSNEALANKLERLLWEHRGMDKEAIWIEAPKEVKEIMERDDHLSKLEDTLRFKIMITCSDRISDVVIRHIGREDEVLMRINRYNEN